MRASSIIAVAAMGFVALSACRQDAAVEPLDIRATMQDRVNPAMLAIWDVGNNALNDEGGIDPALMDDAKWTQVAESADKISAAAKDMAEATAFIAGGPGKTAVAEGEITMAAVQQHVDADPDGLRQMAAAFGDHAGRIAAAARAKDAKVAGDLISGMDGVCESCHLEFWYPEQKELLEQAGG